MLAPLLFRKITRVEAMLFLIFIGLILKASIERLVRSSLSDSELSALPIYPEHRLSYCPTTTVLFDRFEDLSKYYLSTDGKPGGEYHDDLTEAHLNVLDLMDMDEEQYWGLNNSV